MTKYAELWDKIKYLIKTINDDKAEKKSDEKDFMKIEFNSDYNLPLNKILKLRMLTVIVRSVFEEDGKYYPQVFLDDCFYKVLMLEYDSIDISEGTDINKTNGSKDCDICRYWYFKDIGFKYEPYFCNGCHDSMPKSINANDDAIISVKGSDYEIDFCYMSKNEAMDYNEKF